MKQDEKILEQTCSQYARQRGWACWKNENNGNKGIPDRSYLHPSGRFFMVEFKASASAHVRPEQKIWAAKFPDSVFFIHSLEAFKSLLESKSEGL